MKCLSEEHLTVHLETGLNHKVYRCLIVEGKSINSITGSDSTLSQKDQFLI